MNNYPIAVICCDARYKEAIINLHNELSRKGYIVLTDFEQSKHSNDLSDDINKSKIDMASRIFIMRLNNIVCESIYKEYQYAVVSEKSISLVDIEDYMEVSDGIKESFKALGL